ncbi:hypothetical protein ACWEO1_22585 [Kitasatospora cineracea]
MAEFTVTHPDPQFSGDMLGVAFTKGCGQVDTEAEGGFAAYSYFQRAGYATAPVEDEPEKDVAAKAAPARKGARTEQNGDKS